MTTTNDTYAASVLTLYPEMFPGPLGLSLAGRALERHIWSLEAVNIRDFADDKHHTVDGTPAGGGAGMVLRADVVARAVDETVKDKPRRPVIYLSPRGQPLTQEKVRELAGADGIVLLCGRFEGIDDRVIQSRQIEEISLGDYVLSGGEPAAISMLDAIVRLLPGVTANEASLSDESFENNLLEYPHYTRPNSWEGHEIPAILTSGHHGEIAKWRQLQAEEITRQRRPDLWAKHSAGGQTN
jgi:tRNA (guanine37-N1)-methyltransferase